MVNPLPPFSPPPLPSTISLFSRQSLTLVENDNDTEEEQEMARSGGDLYADRKTQRCLLSVWVNRIQQQQPTLTRTLLVILE